MYTYIVQTGNQLYHWCGAHSGRLAILIFDETLPLCTHSNCAHTCTNNMQRYAQTTCNDMHTHEHTHAHAYHDMYTCACTANPNRHTLILPYFKLYMYNSLKKTAPFGTHLIMEVSALSGSLHLIKGSTV